MSQENVEVVRRGFEAMERGDLAALLESFDERVVTRRVAPAPNPGTRYGKEGVLDDMAEWFEGFDDLSVKAEEYIDAGDDVFVEVRQEGRGTASGAPVVAVFWFVFGCEAGKVTRFDLYADRAQALEAVGLSE